MRDSVIKVAAPSISRSIAAKRQDKSGDIKRCFSVATFDEDQPNVSNPLSAGKKRVPWRGLFRCGGGGVINAKERGVKIPTLGRAQRMAALLLPVGKGLNLNARFTNGCRKNNVSNLPACAICVQYVKGSQSPRCG
ncbi:hypothetical protein SAMN05216516_105167 [Izhakiella capsodis]|uniref:Uncharacterized protein n=1 Tax=Izhakiella capsodis TaxID=1367852 RepID=A0A1I4Y2K5_9GAMM|nr:hypothetical protein [Izhakiella capsodis]SFN32292.1 hypothetical protein SAMN05216516_105167 [Izhakiella capsodis]